MCIRDRLAAPDKADDEFLGWYTDSALTKKFIPESQIVKDTTLYARWRNSDTVTYTVKYMCGDVAIADAKQQTVIRNSTVSEPAETVEGYYPETLSISAMTVSYTHLDVYKRQNHFCEKAGQNLKEALCMYDPDGSRNGRKR